MRVPRLVFAALPLAGAVVGVFLFVNRHSATTGQPETAAPLKGPVKTVEPQKLAAFRPRTVAQFDAGSAGVMPLIVNGGGHYSSARPLPPDALELLLAASRGASLGVRPLAFGSGGCVTCAVESSSSVSFEDLDASWVGPALWSVEPKSGFGAFVAEVPMQAGRLPGTRGLSEPPGVGVADNGGSTGPSLPGVSTSDAEYEPTSDEPVSPTDGGDVGPPDTGPKPVDVPEPATILITGVGLATLIVARRRQRRRAALESRLRAEGCIK